MVMGTTKMTDNQQPQPQLPPFGFRIQTAATPMGNIVVLAFMLGAATMTVTVSPKDAIEMGKLLRAEGAKAATGLILPPTNGNGKVFSVVKDEGDEGA